MLRRMNTKLIACWLLLLCLVVPITGCSKNDGTVVGKHPISEFYDDPQMRELAAAAARGDIATIDRLVDEGADVNRQGKEGMQLLLWAMWADNEKGFLRLLEHGADPNVFTELGGSVMKFAAGAKNPFFLKMALEHGGNPNWIDPRNGRSIIFDAINPHSSEPIELLIKARANLNVWNRKDEFASTPVFMAAALNQYNIVYILLQAGADYNITTDGGRSLSSYIEKYPVAPKSKSYQWRNKVVEWLREHGVEVVPAN